MNIMVKTICYIIMTIFAIIGLDSIRIDGIFKKNRYWQSRILYLMIAFSLSYLVVNFIYDFLRI